MKREATVQQPNEFVLPDYFKLNPGIYGVKIHGFKDYKCIVGTSPNYKKTRIFTLKAYIFKKICAFSCRKKKQQSGGIPE